MVKDLDIYSNLKVILQKTFSYFIIVKKWKDKKKNLFLKFLKQTRMWKSIHIS